MLISGFLTASAGKKPRSSSISVVIVIYYVVVLSSSSRFSISLGNEPFECFGPVFFHVPLSSREHIVLLLKKALPRNIPHCGSMRIHIKASDVVLIHISRAVEVWQDQPADKYQLCIRPYRKPFEELGKSKLEEGNQGIENPVSEPLLIIRARPGLYRLYRSIQRVNEGDDRQREDIEVLGHDLEEIPGTHLRYRRELLRGRSSSGVPPFFSTRRGKKGVEFSSEQ